MRRKFKTADDDATLDVTVRLGDCRPPDHLARFVVDTIAQLDLAAISARFAARGGQPSAPEILLGRLFDGYATGVFSRRKSERATFETVPLRFIAGNLHPDQDALATFRQTFLPERKDLFVQVLLLAQLTGVLKLGAISLDGPQIHAAASTSNAVRYTHLRAVEIHLRAAVEELFAVREPVDQAERPDGLVLSDAIAIRQTRLARLAEATAVWEARAKERTARAQAADAAKVQERAAQARQTGRTPRRRAPKPPTPGPRDKAQYNVTDPESRSMKHRSTAGFAQDDNAPIAVDQVSVLIVGAARSTQPNDQQHVEPTLDAIPPELGAPEAAALDAGSVSAATMVLFAHREIAPSSATGRDPRQASWWERVTDEDAPPTDDASPKRKLAYKLNTALGPAMYRVRKCTVEPVIGIIKAVLGFRQFWRRGT